MESRHIKIDFEEAVLAKKQLLSSEMNILQIMKGIKSFKALRKKEITSKNKLRTDLKILKTKINHIYSAMPEEEKGIQIHRKVRNIQTQEKTKIQDELEDIKAKLARLG